MIFALAGAILLGGAHDAEAASKKKRHAARQQAPVNIEQSAKYAAFVAEPETGIVLYEQRADAQRFPASLTKMMTLYELFTALKSGQVMLSDSFNVSAHASIQAPSKLGVKPGGTIRVSDAIKALVVLSANDVAVTIAENLAGTEDAFAKQMTAHARAIGMARTQFVNASGLPDGNQLSTARDMYTLGSRLIADFPEYYEYFALESFRWNGRVFRTHNHLVGKVNGVDGIKTGYTRASGFHLVTAARRNGHRLIAVVMGGDSSRQRDDQMKRLLNTQFAALEKGGPLVAKAGPQTDAVAEPVKVASVEDRPYPRPNPLREAPHILRVEPGLHVEPGAPPVMAAGMTESPGAMSALLVPQAQAAPAMAAADEIRWGIQIGAYVSEATASSKLTAARKALPKLLGHATQTVSRVAVDDTAYYRARFGPLDESDAKRACALLEPRGYKCFAIQAPEHDVASSTP